MREPELSPRVASERAPLEVTVLSHPSIAGPRRPQVIHPYHCDLLESCPTLPVWVSWSTRAWSTRAGDRLLCLPGLEQRLEPWDAAADDSQLDLDGSPYPELEAVPRHIVRLF